MGKKGEGDDMPTIILTDHSTTLNSTLVAHFNDVGITIQKDGKNAVSISYVNMLAMINAIHELHAEIRDLQELDAVGEL